LWRDCFVEKLLSLLPRSQEMSLPDIPVFLEEIRNIYVPRTGSKIIFTDAPAGK